MTGTPDGIPFGPGARRPVRCAPGMLREGETAFGTFFLITHKVYWIDASLEGINIKRPHFRPWAGAASIPGAPAPVKFGGVGFLQPGHMR